MFRASNAALIGGRRLFKNWTPKRKKKNGENRLLAQVTGKGREELGLLSR